MEGGIRSPALPVGSSTVSPASPLIAPSARNPNAHSNRNHCRGDIACLGYLLGLLIDVPAAKGYRDDPESTDGEAGNTVHPEHGFVVEPVAEAAGGGGENDPPKHCAGKNSCDQEHRQPAGPVM